MTKQKPLKRRYRITRKFGLTHFNGKNKYGLFERTLPISVIMPRFARVIKLHGCEMYCKLKFMNHDISTGQKYLPKNYLLEASIV